MHTREREKTETVTNQKDLMCVGYNQQCANSQAFDQAQSFADDCFARYADGALCCQSKKKGCGKPVLGRNLTGTTP